VTNGARFPAENWALPPRFTLLYPTWAVILQPHLLSGDSTSEEPPKRAAAADGRASSPGRVRNGEEPQKSGGASELGIGTATPHFGETTPFGGAIVVLQLRSGPTYMHTPRLPCRRLPASGPQGRAHGEPRGQRKHGLTHAVDTSP
jgi:hypothetical protein